MSYIVYYVYTDATKNTHIYLILKYFDKYAVII